MSILEKLNANIQKSNSLLKSREIVARLRAINVVSNSTEELHRYIDWLSNKAKFMLENDEKIVFELESSYLKEEDENLMISVTKTVGEALVEMIYSSDKELDTINDAELKITFVPSVSEVEDVAESDIEMASKELITNQGTSNENSENFKQMYENERNARIQLMADFQNFRKRTEEEKALFGAISNMGLINDILEVFDDINLALNDEQIDIEQAKNSMQSAQEKIVTAVEKVGVVRIAVNVGDEFNREVMEAISTIDAGEEMKGKVIAVINSAMKYRDRDGIIKHAKVVVGK
jgi:molecular chaperone GrpE